MKTINSNEYYIYIGKESLAKFNYSDYSNIAILVDENTKKYCLPILLENKKLNNHTLIKINSGEEHKNISTCNYIWGKLSDNNFDRNSLLINLGGGVIGDIGGYCASTYKRGINFIHIPTSLLAMVDASIGGKLGVNFGHLKNHIGLFNNPRRVLIYPEFLKTLNQQQIKSGFAEIIKHALIADSEQWNYLKEKSFEDINWEEIISNSVKIKNKIVMSDPKEKKERKKLNFGHTYGHALESYFLENKTPILHGEAVLAGILMEIEISNMPNKEKEEIKKYILTNFILPKIPVKENLKKYLLHDKKNQKKYINFSLLNKIGDCTINNLFTIDEL
tara:strand:+ start:69 stop:1067 length:999 start_codon:yes stop_codon:yes gene_type:complete